MSRATAAVSALLLVFSATPNVHGQSTSLCEGELGQTAWVCDALTPIPAQVFDGADEFLPLPGGADPANPTTYKQIAGEAVTFDEASGERMGNNAAVFVLSEGTYFCMVAESDGEAVLFDAPEGGFVSSSTQYPTSSWLPESVKALLAEGTKLKYIVYTHTHWDHIGAAGLVAEYFAADSPRIFSSRRSRWALKSLENKDPTTAFGNNRGVPLPEWHEEDVLTVGGLQFELNKIHAHQTGDYLIFLDKNTTHNSDQGIDTSVVMITDVVFPGWAPFFSLAVTQHVGGYYEALDTINEYEFDVLVGGHLSRLGTKKDVQVKVDFFADVLAGTESGIATVTFADVLLGTGITDPSNRNVGNTWLAINEYVEQVVDECEAYVLDSAARGRDWLEELAGLEVTLRSQCFAVQSFVRTG